MSTAAAMAPEAAWKLIADLSTAVKVHESWMRRRITGDYETIIDNLMQAEFAVASALTGLPANRVPYPVAIQDIEAITGQFAGQPSDAEIDEAAMYAAMVDLTDEREPIPLDSTVLTDDDLVRIVGTIGRDARAFAGREAS